MTYTINSVVYGTNLFTENLSSQGSTKPYTNVSSQSSHPPVPPFSQTRPSGIHSLLNASPPVTPAHPPLTTDPRAVEAFFQELVQNTSPCSVEQLEQVYSALMSEIWRTRGQWNRVKVVENISAVLRDVLQDMNECQVFGPASMEYLQPSIMENA